MMVYFNLGSPMQWCESIIFCTVDNCACIQQTLNQIFLTGCHGYDQRCISLAVLKCGSLKKIIRKKVQFTW